MSHPDPSQLPFQSDHRAAARFDTALAVNVEGLNARTRNISASGVYFETDVDVPVGTLLNLNVQFTHGGRKHWLACEGKVVRVTTSDGQNGVAAHPVLFHRRRTAGGYHARDQDELNSTSPESDGGSVRASGCAASC
jgi:acyl-coenzyme A thioesterase PaaI-like protein